MSKFGSQHPIARRVTRKFHVNKEKKIRGQYFPLDWAIELIRFLYHSNLCPGYGLNCESNTVMITYTQQRK